MLTISNTQMTQFAQANFVNLFQRRVSELEGEALTLSTEDSALLCSAAAGLTKYGIESVRGCLVVCHVLWDMGLDCLEKLPAFKAIVYDPRASEADKVDAVWLVRTQLFAALMEP